MTYKCRFIYDKKLVEYYIGRYVMLRQQLMFGALAVIIGAAGVYQIVKSGFGIPAVVILAAFIASVAMLFSYKRAAAKAIGKIRKSHGGREPECVYTFSNVITLTEGDTTGTIQYSKITSAFDTGKLYILRSGKATAVIIKKDSVEGGDFADLKEFLKEKCKNAKLK